MVRKCQEMVEVLVPGTGNSCMMGVKGTITLVQTDDAIVLIDCGDPWNREELENTLMMRGVEPNDITHLVITHGHLDHCGNMNLFKQATVIMDHDIAIKRTPRTPARYIKAENWPLAICKDVVVHKFSGHTAVDLVVEVTDKLKRIYMICGDLIENEHDRGFDNAIDVEKLKEAQEYIYKRANFIVPGHGDMFENNSEKFEDVIVKLENDIKPDISVL